MDELTTQADLFKEKFKHYKAKKPPPSLQEVVNICSTNKIINRISVDSVQEDLRNTLLGLKNLTEWKMYTVQGHPGLLCIKNPFTSLGHRYWIRKCLEVYTVKPNKSNIDIEMNLSNWWSYSLKNYAVDKVTQKKMRWVTLGYHHNWDTKVYSEKNRGSFPEDLAELCDIVANFVGYTKFKSQAAIINYYHMDSTLSPHTDHSEINLDAPLFSFSFGQSALFLIGGPEKTVSPSAILLESGDILIMSKEARLCYHAVPKILPASETPWNKLETSMDRNASENIKLKYIHNSEAIKIFNDKNKIDEEWHPFDDFISESRININVRQVLNETQTSL